MKTKILNGSNDKNILQAVALLKKERIVAFPTETVYGLGASVLSENAIQKIYTVKGRPSDNPLIAHISDMSQLHVLSPGVPQAFYTLAEKFFPGPLTLVVKKSTNIPAIGTAGLESVGIRMPLHPVARALISSFGTPLFAPSANISGRPSPTNAQDVYEDLQGKIEVILDGGTCDVGIESTVLDLTSDVPTILRPGVVTRDALEKVLGGKVHEFAVTAKITTPKAPGMKYKHYAPQAEVIIVSDWENHSLYAKDNEYVILTTSPDEFRFFPSIEKWPLSTATVFAQFRMADRAGKKYILIDATDQNHYSEGLWNRISKAANKTS